MLPRYTVHRMTSVSIEPVMNGREDTIGGTGRLGETDTDTTKPRVTFSDDLQIDTQFGQHVPARKEQHVVSAAADSDDGQLYKTRRIFVRHLSQQQ